VTPYYSDDWLTVYQGDCRAVMAAMEPESVHCVVTSPPYWGLRDYGTDGQLGLEPSPEAYVENMVAVFREVRRVLRADGTLWLNLGDSYAAGGGSGEQRLDQLGERLGTGGGKKHSSRPSGRAPLGGLKPKDLVGIPWRVAFALQADGWYLRSDIIWSKPNPMPESVTDRPTKAHEYLFLLSKSARYYFDADAVAEPAEYAGRNGAQHSPYGQGFTRRSNKQAEMASTGSASTKRRMSGFNDRWDASEDAGTAPLSRNIRSVWTIATQPYPGAHFATFPSKLVEPCVKAGSPSGGAVLDPFAGSGTTGMVAQALGRRAVLIDLNGDYLVQAMRRNQQSPLGLDVA
jgi:DNA modification methylase